MPLTDFCLTCDTFSTTGAEGPCASQCNGQMKNNENQDVFKK